MLRFLMPTPNLQRKDAFFLNGFDLRDDVVIDPEDRHRNPSSPFVPESSHPTLYGDDPCPFGAPGHLSGFRLDDPSRSSDYVGFVAVE